MLGTALSYLLKGGEEHPSQQTPQEKKKSCTPRRSIASVVLRKYGESEGSFGESTSLSTVFPWPCTWPDDFFLK